MAKGKDGIVVGLDIGTTKICAIVGSVEDGRISIIGTGTTPSRGLRKGVVIDIDSTVECIKKAVDEAELMAGVPIQAVYAGIAGGHIRGLNSHGVVAVKTREITKRDVERVLESAQAVAMPQDREVIHLIPQEYIVDDQDGIKDPVGMSGVRLEGKVHIVTGAVTSAQNIIKSCNKAGLDVLDIVLEPLAASEAVLRDDEKELGVAVVDVGGGTCDLALFSAGAIKHTEVVVYGGNNVINDVAYGLRAPVAEAESVMKRYGCALAKMVDPSEQFEFSPVGGQTVRRAYRHELARIIESRMEEIFEQVNRQILKAGLEKEIPAGIVLTGGTVMLEGSAELAEEVFNLPVRRGLPLGIAGLVDAVNSPLYATGVGLVKYAARHGRDEGFGSNPDRTFDRIVLRMKEWWKDFF